MITDWLQGILFRKKYCNNTQSKYIFVISRLKSSGDSIWFDKMTRYAQLQFNKSTNKLPWYAPVSAHLHDTEKTWYVFTPIWARKWWLWLNSTRNVLYFSSVYPVHLSDLESIIQLLEYPGSLLYTSIYLALRFKRVYHVRTRSLIKYPKSILPHAKRHPLQEFVGQY